MEKKYIHYCWFGDKPLPKLAKKCIKSWKKYLPDYEIIKWSEENVDLEECPFIKEAYENKKWAFVADYARTKAIYEYGGIYFDTDMEVVKNIDELLNTGNGFLGVEDSHMIACGVWYEPKKHSYLATEMLKFYRSQKSFDINSLFSISIPKIISSILTDYDATLNETQKLKHNETIYRRDYFYPYSYDFQNNIFTDDTCMIHYYDASWVPKAEQREVKIYRILGKKNGRKFISLCRFAHRALRKIVRFLLYPLILYKRRKNIINSVYLEQIKTTIRKINANKSEYIVFHNPNWLGVTSATTELFDNRVECGELLRKKDIKLIGNAILNNQINQIVFSAMCVGWKDLAIYLKKQNPNIKIKTFWHGSHSQVLESYGWDRSMEIYKLHKQGIIDVMGFCKKSLIDFYKNQGCNVAFITNRVKLPKITKSHKKEDKLRIGLYASASNVWHKNMFTQLAAASRLDNVIVDMVPLNSDAISFAQMLGLELTGVEHSVPRKELLQRFSNNDLNLYVTFTECAPMLPLESFESGVPCLVGNNNHYFCDTELEKFLVVDNETNILDITKKIENCLNNKEKILNLYKDWVKNNNKQSQKDVKNFINM